MPIVWCCKHSSYDWNTPLTIRKFSKYRERVRSPLRDQKTTGKERKAGRIWEAG